MKNDPYYSDVTLDANCLSELSEIRTNISNMLKSIETKEEKIISNNEAGIDEDPI